MTSLVPLARHTPRQIVNFLTHRHHLRAFSRLTIHSRKVSNSQSKRFLTKLNRSTATNQIRKFTPFLGPFKHVRSHVSGANVNNSTTKQGVIGESGSPICISVRKMHYKSLTWDPNIHNLPVTSVETPYPARQLDNTVREEVFSLFSVPTLRHLTLNGFTYGFPEGYGFIPEIERVEKHLKDREKTSNVEYLSIQKTEDNQLPDLREIMRWPKALKGFECNLSLKGGYSSDVWDVSKLIGILQPQHASLEQISTYFPEITAGTFGTLFQSFPKLKRLSMPREFLVRLDGDGVYCLPWDDDESFLNYSMRDLHLALPPALEELVLNIVENTTGRAKEEFKECFKQMAMHKQELYPSLKRVVLWDNCQPGKFTPKEIAAQEKGMADMFELTDLFESLGIELVYKVSPTVPGFQDPYVCPDAEPGQCEDAGKTIGV